MLLPSYDPTLREGVAIVVPNALAAALAVLAACWTTGDRRRRMSGVVLAITAMAPAWLVPAGQPVLRAASALLGFSWTMRLVDLRTGDWALSERIGHTASVVDTRRLRRVPRHFEARDAWEGGAWLTLGALAYGALRRWGSLEGVAREPVRWGLALVLLYAGVAAMYAIGHLAYAGLGFETGPLHVTPARSRSVQELWGERWARPVSAWLRDTFFRPLARRRHAVAGALLAFLVSAAFHAYVVWVALGFWRGIPMALSMLAYFLAQAGVVGLERLFRVRRWSAWSGHAWTVAWMLATAPLFLEPALRVLGQSGQ